MVQAARSGVQNIAEGTQPSGMSKKTELKLTNVARASLEELRLDYEDYLRQRGLALWPPAHPALMRFKAKRCATLEHVRVWVEEERRGLTPTNTDGQGRGNAGKPSVAASVQVRERPKLPSSAELVANAALSLLNLACHLLDKQIAAKAKPSWKKGASPNAFTACAAKGETVAKLFESVVDAASPPYGVSCVRRPESICAVDTRALRIVSFLMRVEFKDIEAAAKRIAGHVIETPCPYSIPLSEATGMQIFCKLEYLQRTGSFKERGARNALLQLAPEQQQRGVIAASAGNHALGLAWHAKLLGIPVTVVMPRFAPLTKVANCQRFGARVLLEGATLTEAKIRAEEIRDAEGLTYINGYDDPEIIAGQGTIGLEIAAQVPDLDAIVVPIGGAGLVAGLALALKTLKPEVQIIGVEPEHASSFSAALSAGHPVNFELKPTLADGLAVSKVGGNAFAIARDYVDRTVLVAEHDLALAVLRLMELEKAVVEGAGAAPLAACLAGLVPELKGKKVVLPLCGGNIDLTTLDRVLERGLAFDGRLCRFTATISDRPGGLARFAGLIAEEGASVMHIAHDRAFNDDINTVTVHCVLETRDSDHIAKVIERLNREGFRILQ